MVGKLVGGKYRVLAAIGEGGMSSIYEAEHVQTHRCVALKVLHPALADDPEAIARLQREAKVVSTISHPNICEVFDLGRTEEGSPYLVMERLRGDSLAARIKQGAFSFADLAPLLRQVLGALGSAHALGILHRDLKPENIFVEDGRHGAPASAKLLDFGISKAMSSDFGEDQRLTHTGMVMGTPYYMAPEQARGDSALDQRVDLWAVGVLMYEALSGRRPFVATNYNALLVKILTSRPRPLDRLVPSLHPAVLEIVERALSKLREDRYQTAEEFVHALRQAEKQTSGAVAPMLSHEAFHSPSPQTNQNWAAAIDDPSTIIDDDQPYQPMATATRREGAVRGAAGLSATVQDRRVVAVQEPRLDDATLDDDAPYPALADDSSGDDSLTDVNPPRFLGEEGTEVMQLHRLDPSMVHRHGAELPAGVAPRSVEMPAMGRPPPSVPRRPAPDDEKTTIYDIEAARRKLAERQAERLGRQPPDDDSR